MPKRIVVYGENGEVLYDGPEKLPTEIYHLPFGITVKDIVQLMAILVAVIVFFIRTDETIKQLKEISVKNSSNIELTKNALANFIKNSDGYHSAIIGIQFEGGKPLNSDATKTSAIRKLIGEAEASEK